jgi:thiamine-phosphate pyrophosphorylase
MKVDQVQAVREWFGHLTRGDLETALSQMSENVVLDLRNSIAPWAGLREGRDAALAVYSEITETFSGAEWATIDGRPFGRDLVVVSTEMRVRGASTGIETIGRGAWLARYEDGLIVEAKLFQTHPEALLEARRRALAAARLYFVCEAQPNGVDPAPLLAAAIRGGVDVIQMREKAPRCAEELISFSMPFARAAREHGALFFLNDEPGLVEQCGADGVHVGQDDEPVASARAAAGAGALVGLSTHSPEQLDAALSATGPSRPDQISAGPVWETPTKEGRPAAGLELIEHAARVAPDDAAWFAIGGIDAANIGEVVAAGAQRAVVVRAIRDAADPESAARELRSALESPAAV